MEMKLYKGENFIADGSSIGVFFSSERYNEPLHYHDFIELIYIFSGSAEHYIDGEIYSVEHGDMLFINYGSLHSFTSREGFSHYNICFSPETVGKSIITRENAPAMLSLTAFNELRKDKSCGKISFSGAERAEIERLHASMLEECRKELPYRDKLLESYMSVLITKMLRKTIVGAVSEKSGIWDELKDYIDANLGGDLTLSALASKSFYNPSYFSRMFKQKFGSSLTEYVTQKRIELAVRLLSSSRLSVEGIAEKCGFPDRSAFCHAFKKYMNATPTEYRQGRAKETQIAKIKSKN